VEDVVRAGDTFTFDPAMTESTARAIWPLPPPGRTVVATAGGGAVLGTAKMNPNQAGPRALYEALGFAVVGTIPGGFRHPAAGYVDLLVMYRAL